MTGIELYSTTAANNNSAVPNGFPEGMAPSGVNDSARQVMAAIREWYETAEWINLGYTPTYIGATSFSVTGDKTTTFQVGRRVKAYGTTPFTIYGTIATSVYASVTTVTVTWDSGSLDGTLSKVWVGISSVTNPSIYASAISGLTAAITAAAPSAPFIDSTAIIKGSGDATKLFRIEADGISTATTRVMTVPDYDFTVSSLAGTETLTNKTLTSPTINSGALGASSTATTQAITDNSTKLATTAFVKQLSSPITNSLSSDVTLTTIGTYYDGPSIAQGTSGTWFVSGSVTMTDTGGGAQFVVKLWDGTTQIATSIVLSGSASQNVNASLSGFIASPAGNLRISVQNATRGTTGKILATQTSVTQLSTITAIRIA